MISLSSQLTALRRLNGAGRDLRLLDKRLATGVNVADTRDSTAATAASRASRARATSFSAVQTSLDRGLATVATASAATAKVGGILAGMRGLLAAAKDPNADLGALQTMLADQQTQLRATVAGAAFKNVNLLASATATGGYLGAAKDGAAAPYQIGLDRARTRLLDTAGATGILQRFFDLASAPGTAPATAGLAGPATQTAGTTATTPTLGGIGGAAASVAGLNANPPATTGLSGAASAVNGVTGVAPSTGGLAGTAATVAGAAGAAATGAKVAAGTSTGAGFNGGDTVKLNVQLNGVTKEIKVYQRSVSSNATLQAELQRAVDAEFGAGVLAATVAADNKITLETVATGAAQNLDITSGGIADGDDVLTASLGLAGGNGTYSQSRMNSTDGYYNSSYTYDYISMGTVNLNGIDRNDRISFRVWSRDEGANQSVYLDVSVALAGVTTAAQLATAIDNAFASGGRLGGHNIHAMLYNGEIRVLHYPDGGIDVANFQRLNGDGAATGSLGFTTSGAVTAGTNAAAAAAASATTGTDFAGPVTLQDGAALNFTLTVNGTAKAVSINKATIDNALTGQAGYTAGSGTIADVGKLALVAQRALADAGVSGIAVAAAGNRLRFTKNGTPANGDSVDVSGVSATSGTSTAATLTTGSDFSGPRTIAANASLDFTLTVDGAAKAVSITKADVETALNGRAGYTNGSGTIASAADLALAAQAAMTRQNLTGVAVAAQGNRLRFAKTAPGAGSLAISGVAGTSAATNAVATAGSSFASAITVAGDAAITFDLAVDNGAARAIRIDKATVEAALAGVAGRTSGTGTIASAAELDLVVTRALADAGVAGLAVDTSGGRITLTRTAAGAGSVTLANVQASASTATGAALTTGSDFAGPVTLEPGATIGFDLAIDNGAATRVTIRHATVEAALAGVAGRTSGTGTIATAAELALVVTRALADAGVAGLTAAADGNRLRLTKTATGAGQVAIGAVAATAAATAAPSTTTLDSLNLSSAAFLALSAPQRQQRLDDYVLNLEAIAKRVAAAASYLDLVNRQMEIQSQHTGKLQSVEASRVSTLVNTNLSADEARKTALQSRLALARKSIEIINQSRNNILAIFTN